MYLEGEHRGCRLYYDYRWAREGELHRYNGHSLLHQRFLEEWKRWGYCSIIEFIAYYILCIFTRSCIVYILIVIIHGKWWPLWWVSGFCVLNFKTNTPKGSQNYFTLGTALSLPLIHHTNRQIQIPDSSDGSRTSERNVHSVQER